MFILFITGPRLILLKPFSGTHLKLESPNPRDLSVSPAEQLHRLGLLEADEIETSTDDDGDFEF